MCVTSGQEAQNRQEKPCLSVFRAKPGTESPSGVKESDPPTPAVGHGGGAQAGALAPEAEPTTTELPRRGCWDVGRGNLCGSLGSGAIGGRGRGAWGRELPVSGVPTKRMARLPVRPSGKGRPGEGQEGLGGCSLALCWGPAVAQWDRAGLSWDACEDTVPSVWRAATCTVSKIPTRRLCRQSTKHPPPQGTPWAAMGRLHGAACGLNTAVRRTACVGLWQTGLLRCR